MKLTKALKLSGVIIFASVITACGGSDNSNVNELYQAAEKRNAEREKAIAERNKKDMDSIPNGFPKKPKQ